MNFQRMSLSQFFKKQSAGEIQIETEGSTADPDNQESQTDPVTEEPETPEPVAEPVADPDPEPVTEETQTEASEGAEADEQTDYQALVAGFVKELNLFGATPEARTAFRTEAARNKGFIEALKNVGIVSDEDVTTTVQQEKGARSYETAPWNKAAIEKRAK